MPVRTLSSGSVSLLPGYYRVQAKEGALMLADVGDIRRGSIFHPHCTYYLQLKAPLERADLRPVDAALNIETLEVTPISPTQFLLRTTFAAGRRHALQRFGSEELLLTTAKDRNWLSEAAFNNVEFRYLRLYGLDDVSIRRNGWSWMESAWPLKRVEAKPISEVSSYKTAACVYVHIHYWETWPEIENVLLNDCQGLDLIITTTKKEAADAERIASLFPRSRIIITENRGRDVGPFLELLRTGVFDGYEAVCKIHGKLSKKNGRETLSGTRIRRYILACLLAEGGCQRAIDMFASNQQLGLAGPANLLLPPADEPVDRYIKTETKQMRSFCARVGQNFITDEIEFFVGTMFWFRPTALELLRRENIGISHFEPENGAKRNTLQHAMERLFTMFIKKAGSKIGKLQPMIPTKPEII
jgi:hypothetical protein